MYFAISKVISKNIHVGKAMHNRLIASGGVKMAEAINMPKIINLWTLFSCGKESILRYNKTNITNGN